MNPRRPLYVSDMDGTLLDAHSQVPPEAAELLNDLARRGVLFTVATARTPATVEPLLAGIDTAVPAVVMTGAALWDRRRRLYIDPRFIPARLIGPLLEMFGNHGITPFVYTLGDNQILDVYHAGDLDNAERGFVADRTGLPLKRFHLSTPAPLDRCADRVMLLFAMGPMTAVEPLAEALRARGDLAVSAYPDIFNPRRGYLEIFARGVSKAAGIRRLVEMTGADYLTVFGDNLNDLSMMAVADRAVAVANASDAVRAAADIVIGPNTAVAVPRYIAGKHP
ncbi:MAG: HAD family phosphatase [Muribaculaceae bacterium]|nr:HAD family phosphatase [Muribaculaceae bacterium]